MDTVSWLLEKENPSARYLALRHVVGRPEDDPQVVAARAAIPGRPPARSILEAQWPAGYWMHPGVGYSPRHKATIWQVIFLAALGMPLTPPVAHACDYVLSHSRLPDGRFAAGACLNGNLLRAMRRLGYQDARLDESLEALAEAVRRDRFCCRFNAPRPLPMRMDAGRPCASGAVKALGAFVQVPPARRSPAVQEAIDTAVAFLAGDAQDARRAPPLVSGNYSTAGEASPRWHRFGFPPDESADLLEALDVLGRVGAPAPPGLEEALEIVRAKRRDAGAWLLEHVPSNTWADFGRPGEPNKWVTIHCLKVLQRKDKDT